ncbi:hypothetical protein B0H11DRAFT_1819058 [Mycena galericulata]|nr:hypothetical protein B0H11DRAFT_1819058 [Mycena galericulata]
MMYHQLSPSNRARVVSVRRHGFTFGKIAEELHCDRSTACRTYHKRHEKENFYDITPGRGRPNRLDSHERCIARRMIKSGQAQTAADVQRARFPDVSARTMRQVLQEEALHGRKTLLPRGNLVAHSQIS